MDLLSYFPLPTPRPNQVTAAPKIQEALRTSDIIVIRCPTGGGKTPLKVMIARYLAEEFGMSSNLLFPSNIVLEQNVAPYPDVVPLHRQSAYRCDTYRRTCGDTRAKGKYFCRGCTFTAARTACKSAKIRAFNYWTYMANKLWAPVLLIDEGHKVREVLEDMRVMKVWRHKHKFPADLRTVADVIAWAEKQETKAAKELVSSLVQIRGTTVVEYCTETYRGRDEELLKITLPTIKDAGVFLWPNKVKKIVLLSATIDWKDIEELGLDNRVVTFVDIESPIPPANRPVVIAPSVNMSYAYLNQALPLLAEKIETALAAHPDERGLIHLPYSIAALIRPLLSNDRLLWHTRDDKSDVLHEFRTSLEPRVLIASGLYEGVDLPYDQARWQIIGKVPYLNLGDEVVKKKMESDRDWFAWEAIKRLLQACGRIVRTPDDFGITYLFDSNFTRLWNEDNRRPLNRRMFPPFFRQAVTFR